ncbi:hypothetical protein SAMN05421780_106219 [Flexibacter flexilis DSM 6793]|uniref:Pre-peptidase C-terminal domain-containing protein n=1 Tax=Flexibacter flexilis DSM 6793 TaxID=927664 RepID=A0A1I1K8E5_9BACT|nr:hypothetical protein [Flexibacter flexilis]SFC54958.1 hypothetical protein SAMN05421780_106219 [Flexibacter flexilis DSM 6793]
MQYLKTAFLSLVVMALATLAPNKSYAQCDAAGFIDHCNGKLVNGYNFLKSFSIDGAKAGNGGKVEYSYVFSKDSNYLVTLCGKDGDAKKLIVTLYDSNRKELGSNLDKASGAFYPVFGYKCSATGIYYLSFSYQGGGECGGSVLGFKR